MFRRVAQDGRYHSILSAYTTESTYLNAVGWAAHLMISGKVGLADNPRTFLIREVTQQVWTFVGPDVKHRPPSSQRSSTLPMQAFSVITCNPVSN